MKKKLLILSILLTTSIVGVGFTTASINQKYVSINKAETNYSLIFSSNKNKFSSSLDSGNYLATTENGGKVNFVYNNIISGGSTTWNILGSLDSYFYNTDPINGITNAQLKFNTDDKTFKIYWSIDDSFDDSYYVQSFTSSQSEPLNFDFDGTKPAYLKLVNTSNSNIDISEISINYTCTSAVSNYHFHSGDGSKVDPFVITKPVHYENMIKLHYEYPESAKAGYYFQFGSTDDRMPGNPTSPVFYETDVYGVVNTKATSTTLNLGGKVLPPLGNEHYPFRGHIDGSNLEVRDFTIGGSGYRDVGIFGYVDSNTDFDGGSPIHNCYWRDYTIDTTGVSNLVNQHDIALNPEHAHYGGDTSVEVGCLAGHTVNSSSFSHCYVNNCTMQSKNNGDKVNSTYGYFGLVENDYLGGQTGRGKDYSFELDSEAIYRTTRQVYDSIYDNPIRTRNGYTEYSTPINGDNYEIYSSGNSTVTKYPLSSAISRNKGFDNNDTYTIEGKTPSNKSIDRNYSFSTIGYQPTITDVEPVEYEAYYTLGNSTKQYMPQNTVYKSDWNGSVKSFTNKDSFSTLSDSGDYLYHNGTNWEYIHFENDSTSGRSAVPFTVNLSTITEFNVTGYGLLNNPSLTSANFYLWIDGQMICNQDVKSKVNVSRYKTTTMRFTGISLNESRFTVNLKRGVHYYAYCLLMRVSTNQGKYTWLRNSNTGVSCTIDGRATINADTFVVTQDMYDNNRNISFSCTEFGHSEMSDSSNAIELYSVDSRSHCDSDIPNYVSPNTFQVPVSGINVKTGAISQLNDTDLSWRKDNGVDYDATGNASNWYKWIAYNTPARTVDTSQSPTYLSDNPDITPRISDGTYLKGYEWQNIDIVGGGVSFFCYKNFNYLFDVKVISIPAENAGNYVTGTIPAADINNKATFYSTKYCPGSIVMYFKNTANAADTNDHTLGNIDFKYVNASALGMSWLNLSTPYFKKGAGNFLSLDNFGVATGDGVVDYETTLSGSITESGAKKCSYCALDSQRRILGVFDSNGNPSTGFLKPNGSYDVDKLLQIDTYVVALGSNSNITNQAWITNISFEYVSNEGYGGTFGSVEYKNTPYASDETIFNFFVNVPSGADYLINIEYREYAETIGGVYFITVISNVALTMNIYLYNSDYVFTLNGITYSSSQTGIEVSPS